jgi:hypothetical protein
MGCWGYGPFDNDGASDLIADLGRKVRRVVNAKTDKSARKYYAEARVVVPLCVMAHGADILGGGVSLAEAIQALARMRSDVEWLGAFREPRLQARAVSKELKAALECMRACRICRRAEDYEELLALGEKARATRVPKQGTWQERRLRRRRGSRARRRA